MEGGPRYDHYKRALNRVKQSPAGVGACYIAENTPLGFDGWSGLVAVSGPNGTSEIEVQVAKQAGVGRGQPVNEQALNELIERLAADFPEERRVEAMKAEPLRLPDLCDDWAQIFRQG